MSVSQETETTSTTITSRVTSEDPELLQALAQYLANNTRP